MVIDQVLDPCTGYMVCLFQKVGRKQVYKNSLITTLLSGEQRTGTAEALLYALFGTDDPSSQYSLVELERARCEATIDRLRDVESVFSTDTKAQSFRNWLASHKYHAEQPGWAKILDKANGFPPASSRGT